MKIRSIVLLIFFPFFFQAQYLEVGGSLGASNYLGDLAPSSLWTSIGQTNWAQGVFVRYNINNFTAFRLDLTHGFISGSDKFSVEDNSRGERNLSFRTEIYEAALLGELNILRFQPDGKNKMFSPYIFGGIALYKFNPQTKFDDQWYDLQPLGTEGQGLSNYPKKYSLTQFSIPVGGGLKVAMNQNFTITFETGLRKTFTDYLDDVSSFYPDFEELAITNGELAAELSWRYDEINADAIPPASGAGRGDPLDLDWYIFSKLAISYNFIKRKKTLKKGKIKRRKNNRSIKCPAF